MFRVSGNSEVVNDSLATLLTPDAASSTPELPRQTLTALVLSSRHSGAGQACLELAYCRVFLVRS